jgi:hypothetical protein
MIDLATLDRPPPGWFAVDVMRRNDTRKWDWVALMIDVDPDDLKSCTCDFPARFYVHPKEYRPEGRQHANAGLSFLASTGIAKRHGKPFAT